MSIYTGKHGSSVSELFFQNCSKSKHYQEMSASTAMSMNNVILFYRLVYRHRYDLIQSRWLQNLVFKISVI